MNPEPLPLLIVGAGPFGLVLSAWARHHGVEHVVVGEPMRFWKDHMPKGMYLRSDTKWHYDPFHEHTIDRFLESRNLRPEDANPFPLALYLEYCDWFRRQKGIEVLSTQVVRLDHDDEPAPVYTAHLADGSRLRARNVALALGFRYFKHIPEAYRDWFPSDRLAHTCDAVDFSDLKGKRVLIIGGRQSAFEWAGLIHEAGAESISLTYRHATPAFAVSEWGWVGDLVDAMVENPAWFRNLPAEEQERVSHRQWAEGRLKLEPWLAPRVNNSRTRLFPETQVTASHQNPDGSLTVTLNTGTVLAVDQVILATGYTVDLDRVPLLACGNVLPRIERRNGYPVLDEHFQSSVPGLFFTSLCAAQDFGPFFGFTVSVRTSARLIGVGLQLLPSGV